MRVVLTAVALVMAVSSAQAADKFTRTQTIVTTQEQAEIAPVEKPVTPTIAKPVTRGLKKPTVQAVQPVAKPAAPAAGLGKPKKPETAQQQGGGMVTPQKLSRPQTGLGQQNASPATARRKNRARSFPPVPRCEPTARSR